MAKLKTASVNYLIILLVLLTGLPLTGAWAATSEQAKIRRLVATEARQIGVPVALAMAVARAESNFDPRALSHKGARGVMQVMPDTALGDYGIQPDRLWEPRINIRLGLHFLKRLIHRYRGRVDLALSYYNGGAAVGVWPRARIIPATYPYLRRVEQYRLDYRQRILIGASYD